MEISAEIIISSAVVLLVSAEPNGVADGKAVVRTSSFPRDIAAADHMTVFAVVPVADQTYCKINAPASQDLGI
jgi:hypothetical protein